VTNRAARVRHTTNEAAPVVVEVAAPFKLQQVESADYRVYIENLRAIGCRKRRFVISSWPTSTNCLPGESRNWLDGVTGRFWDFMLNHDELEKLVEEKAKELSALDDEREEMFATLFGEKDPMAKIREAEQEKEERARWRQTLDFLPGAKLAQFLEIKDRFSAARQDLKQPGNTLTHDERGRKSQELNLEEERQIHALFTPQELEEYKLRTSSAAGFRPGLADFEATEEELRAIARAKMNQKQAPAQGQADAEIKELLGAERFAAYQRASDDAYRQTLRITDRFELPRKQPSKFTRCKRKLKLRRAKFATTQTGRSRNGRQFWRLCRAKRKNQFPLCSVQKCFGAYQNMAMGGFRGLWKACIEQEAAEGKGTGIGIRPRERTRVYSSFRTNDPFCPPIPLCLDEGPVAMMARAKQ